MVSIIYNACGLDIIYMILKQACVGWWYSVVGHMESCDGNLNHCQCHNSGESSTLYFCFGCHIQHKPPNHMALAFLY